MNSQCEIQFPFSTRQEILDLEARYNENQRQDRQELEQTVIGFRQNVQSCGYLRQAELRDEIAAWARVRRNSWRIDQNSSSHIKSITREAFGLDDDWEKLKKLIGYYGGIKGVGQMTASVILHLYDTNCYPIFSEYALRSIGKDKRQVEHDERFWRKYVNCCRAKAERCDVSMRTLDRALWKYSATSSTP